MATKKEADLMPLFLVGGGVILYYLFFKDNAPASALPSMPRGVAPSPPSSGRDRTMWIQSSLNRILSASMPIDGIIGPYTIGAIRTFQSLKGLAVDGIVGPRTEAAIRQELSSPTLRFAPEPE